MPKGPGTAGKLVGHKDHREHEGMLQPSYLVDLRATNGKELCFLRKILATNGSGPLSSER